MLIQINYLVLLTRLGVFTGWVKKGKVEKKKKKIKACFNALLKPITLSMGWWETQPRSPAQVSTEQGECGPSPQISVSHLSLFLASECVCTFVHYRQARPTPRKSKVREQWSAPETPPSPVGLPWWLGFPVLWYSSGSVGSSNIGHMRASFLPF